MFEISIQFTYSKESKMASGRFSNVCSGGSHPPVNSLLVSYDLNTISVEDAFKDFSDVVAFNIHLLK